MKNMDIARALITLTPGAQWVLQGDTLAGLTWLDGIQIQPTETAINAAIAAYVPPLSMQSQITALQAQVQTLIAAQGNP